MASPDIISVVRNFLLDQYELTSVVGSNVYSPDLPSSFTTAQKAITFFRNGGQDDAELAEDRAYPIVESSLQFKCWGDSPESADLVYRTLVGVLNNVSHQTVGSNTLLHAEQTVNGQTLVDPDLHFDYVICFFEATVM